MSDQDWHIIETLSENIGDPVRIRQATATKRCWCCDAHLLFGGHSLLVNGEPALMCIGCIDAMRPEEIGPAEVQHRAGRC
jgi:hypothetical protein